MRAFQYVKVNLLYRESSQSKSPEARFRPSGVRVTARRVFDDPDYSRPTGGVVLLKIGETKGTRVPSASDGYESLDLKELEGGFEGFEVLKAMSADSPAHTHFGPKAHRQRMKTLLFLARRPAA